MSTFTPPVPAQRKVKLTTALKTTLSEQSTKLQSKCDLEHDLLEDIRNYAKQRASMEKEYAQGILKITSQLLGKIQSKEENKEEPLRSPYGLWRKLLEDSEAMANARMKMSQTLLTDVVEGIKNLKSERLTTLKKCTSLAEKLHEEVLKSAADLVKAQKAYTELQKLTIQASEHASDTQEKLRKGNVSIFSSKSKLEKNVCKANERRDASAKRSTIARNDYLLTLAALNAHQRKYYSLDLPDLIAVQDGKIYENFKNYYKIITNAERQACKDCVANVDNLEGHIASLERAYAIQCFLRENPVFTKCDPYEYIAVPDDEVCKIKDEFGAGLLLNKEARKWTLRLAREHKAIRKKSKELLGLKAMNSVDVKISGSSENCAISDNAKTTEQAIDALTEEIRHLEVLRTKAEGRVEALKQAGVNVDEWLQGALLDQDEDKEISSLNSNQLVEEDEFADEEWDDSSPAYNYDNYSDDGGSVSSSIGQKSSSNMAIVLYPFQANSQEELSINVGEELELLETEGDGWCKTRNKSGEVGFVPETYIEIKGGKNASDDGETTSKGSSQESSSITEIKVDTNSIPSNQAHADSSEPQVQVDIPSIVCFAKAIYDYDAIEEEELSFREGDIIMVTSKVVDDDDGWWEGILGGKRGVFPSLVVEETKQPDPSIGSQDDHWLNPSTISQNQYNTIPRSWTVNQYDRNEIKPLQNRDANT